MTKIIARYGKYDLCESKGFYFIKGLNYVDMSGTKEQINQELLRWKNEIDMNNKYMLDMENFFMRALR